MAANMTPDIERDIRKIERLFEDALIAAMQMKNHQGFALRVDERAVVKEITDFVALLEETAKNGTLKTGLKISL